MRLAVSLLVLALGASSALAEPFHHSSGEWRQYHRDWLASCPDQINEDANDYYGFSCFASTGSQELNSASLPAYKLTLMHNRLDGSLDVAVTLSANDVTPDPSRPMVLAFGGEAPLQLSFEDDLETRYNTTNVYYIVDPATRELVIERMKARNAVTLSVPIKGMPETKSVRLSLRGVAASLDFMTTYARRVVQY